MSYGGDTLETENFPSEPLVTGLLPATSTAAPLIGSPLKSFTSPLTVMPVATVTAAGAVALPVVLVAVRVNVVVVVTATSFEPFVAGVTAPTPGEMERLVAPVTCQLSVTVPPPNASDAGVAVNDVMVGTAGPVPSPPSPPHAPTTPAKIAATPHTLNGPRIVPPLVGEPQLCRWTTGQRVMLPPPV